MVDRPSKLLLVAVVVVVLGLIGGAAYLILNDGHDYPSQWDARVEPITQWVAKQRQLSYDHPVKVNFLSEAEYTKRATAGGDATSKEAKQQEADQVAQLRALGFVSGNLDLNAANDTLSDTGTLAYYDPQTKQVYVRGTKLTPDVRVTLAHELTHVLQDQHFDLNRIQKLDSSRGSVLRALAEGDAMAVEDAYVKNVLTSAERADYEKTSKDEGSSAQAEIDKKVPPILTTVFSAPYILGPQLIDYLKEQGGYAAIDRAMKDPPSEEVLFDPRQYGLPSAAVKKVEAQMPKGATKIDQDVFGPTTTYLMLATRLDPKAALSATDGWGGDDYVVYRQDGKVCVNIASQGDTAKETSELERTWQVWATKSPKGTASVARKGPQVVLRSCDPGKDAPATGDDASPDLLGLPVTRTQLYVQALQQHATPKQASCWAEGVINAFTFPQLTDPKGAYVQSAAGQRKLLGVRSTCM